MTNPKRTLYVGGLVEEVDEKTLHAAFIPFGKINYFILGLIIDNYI